MIGFVGGDVVAVEIITVIYIPWDSKKIPFTKKVVLLLT